MIKNYLKVAWRNIWKNKSFSALNVLGLTAGTVCCIYILLYVRDQYGYDRKFTEAESLYRIRTAIEGGSRSNNFSSACSSPPIVMQMKQDFPEVKAATRIVYLGEDGKNMLSAVGSDESFVEPKGYLVDSTFFRVFDYQFIEGKPTHAIDEPYTVVLSSDVAKKLFGKEKALDQQINIGNRDNSHVFKVTGVFDEKNIKTHLEPHFIMNIHSNGLGEFVARNQQWAGQNFIYSYVRLNTNADAKGLEAKLPAFLNKYGADNLRELGMKKHLFLQPVVDIHLYSKGIANQIDKTSDISFLNLLLTIAFVIQLIACINFINLTTARSMKRAREIGVRKVVGALKASLVAQFLFESVLIAIISTLLAVPVVALLMPLLNSFTDGTIAIESLKNFNIVAIILSLGVVTGLLAGIYPALYLSGFRPVSVLKGTFSFKGSSIILRKGLVIFQFSIAIVLIISVIIISKQLNYIQSMDLGFNQEQKLVIPFQNRESRNNFTSLRNELLENKEVNGVTACQVYPSRILLSDFVIYKKGQDMNSGKLVKTNNTDENFIKVMGLQLKAGRNLRESDTSGQVIVNQTVLTKLDIPMDQAVGTKLFTQFEGSTNEFEIVGVTNDYNFGSVRNEISPLMSFYGNRPVYAIVSFNSKDYKNTLSNIGSIWKKVNPTTSFVYSFLDEDVQQQYAEEKRLKKISNSFTILAILISCLGLFGLAMFTAQQRIKEIGVRKVLGASVAGIISMLSKDFLKLVMVSIVIASPIAWWAMNKWLQDYVYKINIGWWVFVMAGVIALLIAFITVSFQAIKAAVANPVKSLRTE